MFILKIVHYFQQYEDEGRLFTYMQMVKLTFSLSNRNKFAMNKRLLHVAKFAAAMTSNPNCTPSPPNILFIVYFVNYVEYIFIQLCFLF